MSACTCSKCSKFYRLTNLYQFRHLLVIYAYLYAYIYVYTRIRTRFSNVLLRWNEILFIFLLCKLIADWWCVHLNYCVQYEFLHFSVNSIFTKHNFEIGQIPIQKCLYVHSYVYVYMYIGIRILLVFWRYLSTVSTMNDLIC